MDLWIRSQDKTQLLNATGIYYDYQEEKHHITCMTKDHDYYWVGIYNSKERALEVLDEIQNILKPKIMIRMDGNVDKVTDFLNINGLYLQCQNNADVKNINNTFVYEMPKE